jgi:hypothetical protein
MPERARASSGLRCARSSSDFCVICGAAVTPGCNRRASSAFRRSCATAAPIRPLVAVYGGVSQSVSTRPVTPDPRSPDPTQRAMRAPCARARHYTSSAQTRAARPPPPRASDAGMYETGRTCAAPSRCSRSPMSRTPAAGRSCSCGGEARSAHTNGRARSDNAAAAVYGQVGLGLGASGCTALGPQGVGPQGFRVHLGGRTCSRIEPSESAGLNVHCRSSSSCQRALLQRGATCSAPRALPTACAVRPARVCARTCAQEPAQARARTSARFLVSSWWRRFRSAHAAMCAELRPAPPNSAALPAEICGVPCRRIRCA